MSAVAVIGRIAKFRSISLRISWEPWQGRPLIFIRQERLVDGAVETSLSHGVCFAPAHLDQLIGVLSRARDEARARGLIHHHDQAHAA